MSKALDYLIEARPDAISSYFAFLKGAGEHLDVKTRDLISVITKVAAQSDRGFRHYLKRALRNGCTANEVIDALLMAFPILGLTKIIWATDILLDMDLPEFQPENLHALPTQWDVAAVDDIPFDQAVYFAGNGRNIFVYRTEQELRVYNSLCPHLNADIPHDALDGNRLTCPKHKWAFDIESGECVEKGKLPLSQVEFVVKNGRLLI